jgi:hypothetical protein
MESAFSEAVVLKDELSGAVKELRPFQRQQRFTSIDVLRGIALLGILIANVTDFGLPSWDYLIPLSSSNTCICGSTLDGKHCYVVRSLVDHGRQNAGPILASFRRWDHTADRPH